MVGLARIVSDNPNLCPHCITFWWKRSQRTWTHCNNTETSLHRKHSNYLQNTVLKIVQLVLHKIRENINFNKTVYSE